MSGTMFTAPVMSGTMFQVECALPACSGRQRVVIEGGYFPLSHRSASAEGVHQRMVAAGLHLQGLAAQREHAQRATTADAANALMSWAPVLQRGQEEQ